MDLFKKQTGAYFLSNLIGFIPIVLNMPGLYAPLLFILVGNQGWSMGHLSGSADHFCFEEAGVEDTDGTVKVPETFRETGRRMEKTNPNL